MADERWLVVGLGNPESEYGGTRHNIGADAVRLLARREHADLARNKKTRCEISEVRLAGAKVVLAVPTSYMNTSGGPVQAAANWFNVPVDRLIVLHDEIDIGLNELRFKRGGGAGGHNGLRDVDRAMGSKEYLRVRIGVGRPPGRQPAKDYVLKRFTSAEREQMDVTLEHVADSVGHLIREGLEPTQNRYHGKA